MDCLLGKVHFLLLSLLARYFGFTPILGIDFFGNILGIDLLSRFRNHFLVCWFVISWNMLGKVHFPFLYITCSLLPWFIN